VRHPDFEATMAVFSEYEGDKDAGLRFALDLLGSGKI
jgi:hypothetical protein